MTSCVVATPRIASRKRRALAVVSVVFGILWPPTSSAQTTADSTAVSRALVREPQSVLHYKAEWRRLHAGRARLALSAAESAEALFRADLHLETTGIVSKLYKVNDEYTSWFDSSFCTSATVLRTNERERQHETRAIFQQPPGKALLLEADQPRGAAVQYKEIDVPACVHDVIAGLVRLRALRVDVGSSIELPLSDGNKSVLARVQALRTEVLKTDAGVYTTVCYEVFLFNGALYGRKARLFIWISTDDRRVPVRIRIQMPFYIGTVSLELERDETSP